MLLNQIINKIFDDLKIRKSFDIFRFSSVLSYIFLFISCLFDTLINKKNLKLSNIPDIMDNILVPRFLEMTFKIITIITDDF